MARATTQATSATPAASATPARRSRTAAASAAASAAAEYLRVSQGGLFPLAMLIGVGAGLGAVAFRSLISSFTWLATGRAEFGQQGRIASDHLAFLGPAFLVVVPVIGGLLYGPLIYRWAREARGHGVPEVMIAVAEHGGRIRPQVSIIKALASALCIATGGSVGREGPIVQIGSAMASGLGQKARVPENRLRILVACGAAGGISATFNAPVTGVFFGVEIILRAFSVEAMFPVMLASMLADAVASPILGSGRFLSGFPAGVALHHPANYLLIAALAVVAAFVGLGFKSVLYKLEDLGDTLWGKRPEWARPAVGGVLLGLLLLAVPQLYGVGYPVMYKAIGGGYALWFLILLVFGKMLATSVSLGIGGSGGVFAPSLFLGVMAGTAYGVVVEHVFGADAGPPALYAAVAMGAVFTAAARAPLTSLASVVEMTGDFTLTLPVMLAVAIATTISRGVSYGTIYTTKLLRRGTDLDRTTPWRALQDVKLADAMRPLPELFRVTGDGEGSGDGDGHGDRAAESPLPGPTSHERTPQAVYATESLSRALRRLILHGRDGLPVLSPDGSAVEGWITNAGALHAIARELGTASADSPDSPHGFRVIEILVDERSPAVGRPLGAVTWPDGHVPVSVLQRRVLREADPALALQAGDRVSLLTRRRVPDA